jgi:hypothetical protein
MQYLLQIETIGPEGDKLIWVFLTIVLIIGLFFLLKGKFNSKNKGIFQRFSFSRGVKINLEKNKKLHPTVIHLNVINQSSKAITIQHPILRFKRGKNTKAFKIKGVNSSSIYPLYLEAKQTHKLPVLLQSFYDYDKKLKGFPRLRIECKYNENNLAKSSYLLLRSTIFRKVKQ